ncbi:MAG: recombinase family protein, partial [Acidobacteriota bacterium]
MGATENAVAYVRVSSEEQVSNLSLDTQESECRKWCADRGIHLLQIFREEGKSAKTVNRPELQALLTFCRRRAKTVDYVLVHDLKRFSRDLVGHYAIRGQLKNLGIGLRSVTEGMIDGTKEGEMMEAIIGAVAQYDNAARSERVTLGMRACLETGRWPFRAPLGYLTEDKKLVHDPKRAPLVRKAFELMATGLYSQREIVRRLTAQGLRTTAGKPISAQTLRRMLGSPTYCGRFSVGGGIDIDGQGGWEPIIEPHIWKRCQAKLSGHSPTAVPHVKEREEFPLKGLLRSEKSPLTASFSKGRKGRLYGYYHEPGGKAEIRIPRQRMHELFLDLLRSLKPRPVFLSTWKAALLHSWRQRCS